MDSRISPLIKFDLLRILYRYMTMYEIIRYIKYIWPSFENPRWPTDSILDIFKIICINSNSRSIRDIPTTLHVPYSVLSSHVKKTIYIHSKWQPGAILDSCRPIIYLNQWSRPLISTNTRYTNIRRHSNVTVYRSRPNRYTYIRQLPVLAAILDIWTTYI